MTVALRPMSLGEILDRTFQIYRSSFWVFVGITAFPAVAMICLQFANLFWWKLSVPALVPILGVNLGSFVYSIGQYHFYLFFHALGWACIAGAVTELQLGNQSSLHSAFAACLGRWRSWLGMTALLWLIVLVIPEVVLTALFIGIAYVSSEVAKASASTMEALLPILTGFFVLAGCALSIRLGAVFLLAIPAWWAEQASARRILWRVRSLSHGCRWKLIFARFMPALIGLVLNWAMSFTLRSILLSVTRGPFNGWLFRYYLLSSTFLFSAAVIATLVGPIFPIGLTLLYYDQRIRKEGYDIERMMNAAGLNESQTPVEALAGESVPRGGDSVEAEVQPG